MRENINKVAERGERLDNLESKTGISPSSLVSRERIVVFVGVFGGTGVDGYR